MAGIFFPGPIPWRERQTQTLSAAAAASVVCVGPERARFRISAIFSPTLKAHVFKAHVLKAHMLKAHVLKAHVLKAHVLKAHVLVPCLRQGPVTMDGGGTPVVAAMQLAKGSSTPFFRGLASHGVPTAT